MSSSHRTIWSRFKLRGIDAFILRQGWTKPNILPGSHGFRLGHPVNWDRLASLEPKGIPDAQAQRARLVNKGRKDRPDSLARRAQLFSQEKPDSPLPRNN
ncbi:hypothetical protein GPALN_009758 [Globodera pallida]|nr:hypothetical protein GPALN_009758 [Globodera pallida]